MNILVSVLTVADVIIALLLICLILVQQSKDSGFGSALVRKTECTEKDYSTVFYYNLVISIILYFALFLSAPAISAFFVKPQLMILVRVLGSVLIIESVTIIQKTVLIKNINFKLQTKISIIASIVSGAISIGMAFGGWGVWSLVYRLVIQNLCMSVLLWLWNTWRPRVLFSATSFKELFGFGSKLLLSGLIDTTYKNIYYLIIGKVFSANELGYYTRAQGFSMLPAQSLTDVIQRVSYPVLSTLQASQERLKSVYKKLIKGTMLISFVLMIGMAAIAKPLVITLIGEKWTPSVIYLQLLCFGAMLYPLHALNLNILNVKGRSDLFLRLEIIKKLLVIPTVVMGIFLGIKIMIIGMIVNSIIAYFLNSFWSGKIVSYPFREQIADIAPSFLIALIIGAIVYVVGLLLFLPPAIALAIETTLGILFFWIATKITKIDSFVEIKGIIKENVFTNFRKGTPHGEI